MRITRRNALVLLGGTAAAGGAWALNSGSAGHIRTMIARNFGAEIAATPDAEAFAADFAAAETAGGGRKAQIYRAYFRLKPTGLPALVGAEERVEERLVRAFLQSTNVAQVHPDADAFRYGGLFDPYATPCGNHLSAHFLA